MGSSNVGSFDETEVDLSNGIVILFGSGVGGHRCQTQWTQGTREVVVVESGFKSLSGTGISALRQHTDNTRQRISIW